MPLQNVQRQLSCWLRDQVGVYPNYGAANVALVQFFKQQAEAARQVGWLCMCPGWLLTCFAQCRGPAVAAGKGLQANTPRRLTYPMQ